MGGSAATVGAGLPQAAAADVNVIKEGTRNVDDYVKVTKKKVFHVLIFP